MSLVFCLRIGLLHANAYDSAMYITCHSLGVEVIGGFIDGRLCNAMSDLQLFPDFLGQKMIVVEPRACKLRGAQPICQSARL